MNKIHINDGASFFRFPSHRKIAERGQLSVGDK